MQPIVLLPTLSNQAHAASERHDDFVSQLRQDSAHPRRVHPRLQRNPAARHSAKHFPHFVFNFAQFPVRCVAIVWGGGFMADSDAPRLRELAKEMASENDPARLKVLAEELKTILAKHRSMQPTESGAR
jgi:hypothetical protein